MTPLKDVRKLLPGERLIVGGGRIRSERYWRYPAPDPDFTPSVEEWAERLASELDDAVRMRMMSDVPVGALLSGGLDSSLVVALMARHSDRPVKTFSVGFAGVGKANELPDARRVAAHLGAEHHELELSLAGPIEVIERLVWHMDEPVRDLSAHGLLALSDLAAQEITVALSGQGADELFGGLPEAPRGLPGGDLAPPAAGCARASRGRRASRARRDPPACRGPPVAGSCLTAPRVERSSAPGPA